MNTNDIFFQSNSDTYIQYDVSESKIVASKLIQCGGNLTVLNTKTQCFNVIACDNFGSRNTSTIINHIMNESTGEIKFYVGSPIVPDTTTNLIMTKKDF